VWEKVRIAREAARECANKGDEPEEVFAEKKRERHVAETREQQWETTV
jgi:hypothetical protein